MLEKEICTRNVGMEPVNCVGSTGSCDSMESISSNHSELSGYDHLSAEERECLMFLEETIDSLDNEDDSGLSTDELETTEKLTSRPVSELEKLPRSVASEKASPKITTVPKQEEWINVDFECNTVSRGYHSFPRAVQATKESSKQPSGSEMEGPKKDQVKLSQEKPQTMSSFNQHDADDSLTSEYLILPPPKAFRDPQIVDKRRSVTDPTDAREVKLDRTILKSVVTSEVPPRQSLPNKDLVRSQEAYNQLMDKQSSFKQGPPTAPKPRALPPYIIIKTSKGIVQNLDPQKRPRTFSAHERSTQKTNEYIVLKAPNSREQERMRLEALKKLGLEEGSSKQENSSVGHSRANIDSLPDGSNQGQQDAIRNSVDIHQQDGLDSQRTTPAESTTIAQALVDNTKNETIGKPSLSIKLNSSDNTHEPVSSTPFQKGSHISSDGLMAGVKSGMFGKNRPSVKKSTQENMEEPGTLSGPPLNEVHETAHISSINVKSDSPRNISQSNPVLQLNVDGADQYLLKESCAGADNFQNQMRNINKSPQSKRGSTVAPQASHTVQEKAPVTDKTSECLSNVVYSQVSNPHENKRSSSESTSSGSTSSFPRPKEVLVSQHSPEVIRRDEKQKLAANKRNRHSTQNEPLSEQSLRLPQGLVPGLRQINIKSSTLERSGIGLSGSLPNIEKETQKGGNSFFRKPLFSGNFLRNNRPRPLSLGMGKDFAILESSSTADADNAEKRSFFSRPSRSSAPVTSVKITPKGSTDEHRREALKKLGILKE